MVIIGRCLLGATSAESVATQAFVATNTKPVDRRRFMSINTLVSQVLTIAGAQACLRLGHSQSGTLSRGLSLYSSPCRP